MSTRNGQLWHLAVCHKSRANIICLSAGPRLTSRLLPSCASVPGAQPACALLSSCHAPPPQVAAVMTGETAAVAAHAAIVAAGALGTAGENCACLLLASIDCG
jgi:hypothetical protein